MKINPEQKINLVFAPGPYQEQIVSCFGKLSVEGSFQRFDDGGSYPHYNIPEFPAVHRGGPDIDEGARLSGSPDHDQGGAAKAIIFS